MRRVVFARLWGDQRGAATVEYTILLGLLAAGLLLSITAVATWTQGKWSAFETGLAANSSSSSGSNAGGNGNGWGAGGNGNGNNGNGNGNGGPSGNGNSGNGKN